MADNNIANKVAEKIKSVENSIINKGGTPELNEVLSVIDKAKENLAIEHELSSKSLLAQNFKLLDEKAKEESVTQKYKISKNPLDIYNKLFMPETDTTNLEIAINNQKIKQIGEAYNEKMKALNNLKNDTALEIVGNNLDYTRNRLDQDKSKEIASYGVGASLLDTILKVGGPIQGIGEVLDLGVNRLVDGIEYLTEGKVNPNNDVHGFSTITNFITTPTNYLRKKLNYSPLVTKSSYITDAARRGDYLGSLGYIATGFGEQIGPMATSLALRHPATAALYGLGALAEHNKEKQAEKLHTTASQILNTDGSTDMLDVLGAVVSTVAAAPEAILLSSFFTNGTKQALKKQIKKATKGLSKEEAKKVEKKLSEEFLAKAKDEAAKKMTINKAAGKVFDKLKPSAEFSAKHPYLSRIGTGLAGLGVGAGAIGTGLAYHGSKGYALEYPSEFLDTLGSKIGNEDFKNKSALENISEMHEAGKLGGILGSSIASAHVPINIVKDGLNKATMGIQNENNSNIAKVVLGDSHSDKFEEYEEYFKTTSQVDLDKTAQGFKDFMESATLDENGNIVDKDGKSIFENVRNELDGDNNKLEELKRNIYGAAAGKFGEEVRTAVINARNRFSEILSQNKGASGEDIIRQIEKEAPLTQLVTVLNAVDPKFLISILQKLKEQAEQDINGKADLNAYENEEESSEVNAERLAREKEIYNNIIEKANEIFERLLTHSDKILGKNKYSDTEKEFARSIMKSLTEHAKQGDLVELSTTILGYKDKSGRHRNSIFEYVSDIMKSAPSQYSNIKARLDNFLAYQNSKKTHFNIVSSILGNDKDTVVVTRNKKSAGNAIEKNGKIVGYSGVDIITPDNFEEIKAKANKEGYGNYDKFNSFQELLDAAKVENNKETTVKSFQNSYIFASPNDGGVDNRKQSISTALNNIALEIDLINKAKGFIDFKENKVKEKVKEKTKKDSSTEDKKAQIPNSESTPKEEKSKESSIQSTQETKLEEQSKDTFTKEDATKDSNKKQVVKSITAKGRASKGAASLDKKNTIIRALSDLVSKLGITLDELTFKENFDKLEKETQLDLIQNLKDISKLINSNKYKGFETEYPVVIGILNDTIKVEQTAQKTTPEQKEDIPVETNKETKETEENNKKENKKEIKPVLSYTDFKTQIRDALGWDKFIFKSQERIEELKNYLTELFIKAPLLYETINEYADYSNNKNGFKDIVDESYSLSINNVKENIKSKLTSKENDEKDSPIYTTSNLEGSEKNKVTKQKEVLNKIDNDIAKEESKSKEDQNEALLGRLKNYKKLFQTFIFNILDKFNFSNELALENKLAMAKTKEELDEIKQRIKEAFSFMNYTNNNKDSRFYFMDFFEKQLESIIKLGENTKGSYQINPLYYSRNSEKDFEILRFNNAINLVRYSENIRLAMLIQAAQLLLNPKFKKSYNTDKIRERLERAYGEENINALTDGELIQLDGLVPAKSLQAEVGEKVFKMLNIKPKDSQISHDQESILYSEIGMYICETLIKMGVLEQVDVQRVYILNDITEENADTSVLNFYKFVDNNNEIINENSLADISSNKYSSGTEQAIFSKTEKDAQGNFITTSTYRDAFNSLNSLYEDLNTNMDAGRPAYQETPYEDKTGLEVDTTSGGKVKVPKAMRKSINQALKTPWNSPAALLLNKLGLLEDINILANANEKYVENLAEGEEDFANNYTILYENKDSQKGKNLGIENEIGMFISYFNDMYDRATDTLKDIFFDFRMSANMREFLQTVGVNPQTQKFARFLLLPVTMNETYKTDKDGNILHDNGDINWEAYQGLAQGFGFSTDKKSRNIARKIGQGILNLVKTPEDYIKFEESFVDSVKNAKEYDFKIMMNGKPIIIEGHALNISELGHAFANLNALKDYANRDKNGEFTTILVQEIDGINNGLILKLIQLMLDPSYVELLKSGGIDAVNQASDLIGDYFAGKKVETGEIQKVLDLYETIAKDLSKEVEKTTTLFSSDKEKAKEILREEHKAKGETDVTDARLEQEIEERKNKFFNSILSKLGLGQIANKEDEASRDILEEFITYIMDYTQENYALINGAVPKSTRDNVKPIVMIFGYSAGFPAQARKIASEMVNSLPKNAFKAVMKKYLSSIDESKVTDEKTLEKIKQYKEYIGNDYTLSKLEEISLNMYIKLQVIGVDYNSNGEITLDSLSSILDDFHQGVDLAYSRRGKTYVSYGSLLDTELNFNTEDEGGKAYIKFRKLVYEATRSTMLGMIENVMESKFPMLKLQNDLTNEIYNNAIIIAKSILESKIAKFKANNPDSIITKNLMKDFLKEVEPLLPGIRLSLANKGELQRVKDTDGEINNTELKRRGKATKTDYSVSIQMTNSREGSSQVSHPVTPTLSEVGASSGVFQIHQEDGSTIAITLSMNAVEVDGKMMRSALGVFDALIVSAKNALGINKSMNENLFTIAKYSATMAHTLAISVSNLSNFIKYRAMFNTGEGSALFTIKGKDGSALNDVYENKLTATKVLSELLHKVTLINREIFFSYKISVNNIQNNLENSAYLYNKDNSKALDAKKEGQRPEDLMISLVNDPKRKALIDKITTKYMELSKAVRSGEVADVTKLNKDLIELIEQIWSLEKEIIQEYNNKREPYKDILRPLSIIIKKEVNNIMPNMIDDSISYDRDYPSLFKNILSTKILSNLQKNGDVYSQELNDGIKRIKRYINEAIKNGMSVKEVHEIISTTINNYIDSVYSFYDENFKEELKNSLFEKLNSSYYNAPTREVLDRNTTEESKQTEEESNQEINEKPLTKAEKDFIEEEGIHPGIEKENAVISTDPFINNVNDEIGKTKEEENIQNTINIFNAMSFPEIIEYIKNNTINYTGVIGEWEKNTGKGISTTIKIFSNGVVRYGPNEKELNEDAINALITDMEKNPNNFTRNLIADLFAQESAKGKVLEEVTLSEDLKTNIDTILDIKNNMRSVDERNGRALSEEESNRLSEVLSTIIKPVSKALDGIKVVWQKIDAAKNTGGYFEKINTIVVKTSSALADKFKGFMSAEEIFAHEIIHPSVRFTIRQNNGNNKYTRILRGIYNQFLANVNENTIADALADRISDATRRKEIAHTIYKHFTTNEDSIVDLEEFNAIGLTSEVISNLLKNIKVSKDTDLDLYSKLSEVFTNAFNYIFGDNLKGMDRAENLYDALVVLNTHMANANAKAKKQIEQEVQRNKAIKNTLRNRTDKYIGDILKQTLSSAKGVISRKIVTRLGLNTSKNPGYVAFKKLLALGFMSFVEPFHADLVKKMIGMYPLFAYNTITGSLIDDLSEPSKIKRKAEQLHRLSNGIDAYRNYEYEMEGKNLQVLYTQDIDKKTAQDLGDIVLNTDLSSLDLPADFIIELLQNPETLQEAIKIKRKALIDSIKESYDNSFKKPIDDYIAGIMYQSEGLAHFMTTGKVCIEGQLPNAYMITNIIGTAKTTTDVNSIVTKLTDEYITLLALEMKDEELRQNVGNFLVNDKEAFEHTMVWFKGFTSKSKEANSGGNKYQRLKNYREFIQDPTIDLTIGFGNQASKYALIGYKEIDTNLKEVAYRYFGNEGPRHYINTSHPQQTPYMKTAYRFITNRYEGYTLNKMFNNEVAHNPNDYDFLVDKYQEIDNRMKEGMISTLSNSKKGVKPNKNINYGFIPVFDESGNVVTFSYTPDYNTRLEMMGLDNDLFTNVGKLQSVYYDRVNSADINLQVLDALIEDYNNTPAIGRKGVFMEITSKSKNEEARALWKMLPEKDRVYLENNMNGVIEIREELFYRFFGYRPMNIKNTKWYKQSNKVSVKMKHLLASVGEINKKIATFYKQEVVSKNPNIIYGNGLSNMIQCWNYGLTIPEVVKGHFDAIKNIKFYKETQEKIKKLEFDKRAGKNVNPKYIESLNKELELNPIHPLVKEGFLNTIAEDLTPIANGYIDRKISKWFDSINKDKHISKALDLAYLTDNNQFGKMLNTFTKYSDFISRCTLYDGLIKRGKSHEEAINMVSDAFINYDIPVSKGIKAANDHGLALFTRFFTRSQRPIMDNFKNNPVSTTIIVLMNIVSGRTFNFDLPTIYDTYALFKDYGYMLDYENPLYNLYDAFTPGSLNFIPGIGSTTANSDRRKSIFENIF